MRILCALALALSGCSFAAESSSFVENHCANDDECPGARCDDVTSMCVSGADMPIPIAIQVTPASDRFGGGTPLPLVIRLPEAVGGPTSRDLILPLPTKVFGTVRHMTDSGIDEIVQSEITFVPHDSIVTGGATRVAAVTTAEARTAPDMGEMDYDVLIYPDAQYDVIVKPIGEQASRLRRDQQLLLKIRHLLRRMGGIIGD